MILAFFIWFVEMRWIDILDVALVALLLFQLYKLIRGSVASKILVGFLSFYLLYLMVKVAKMELLGGILDQFAGVGIVAAIVLFQQEIRRFLLMIGKNTTFNADNLKAWRKFGEEPKTDFVSVIDAAKTLSATSTGALIVFAKSTELKFYQESGDPIDAVICKRLLVSIFNKTSPLHDGAVIISKGRIKAARCILPISENDELPAYYGMRHRAALGMSEVTDSVILIVSEETGQISLTYNGKM
ncbi:MAG: diadenylate cyclase CdaA, partial [Cytophagales bacterium]